MKIVLMITALLLSGASSWADSKHDQCGHEAWQAAKPTAEQTAAAEAYFAPVKKMFQDNKDAIEAAKAAFMAALKNHPIVKADATSTGKALFDLVMPIKSAAFSAVIDSINLLSLDQRHAFDDAFMACKKKAPPGDLTGMDWSQINFANSF